MKNYTKLLGLGRSKVVEVNSHQSALNTYRPVFNHQSRVSFQWPKSSYDQTADLTRAAGSQKLSKIEQDDCKISPLEQSQPQSQKDRRTLTKSGIGFKRPRPVNHNCVRDLKNSNFAKKLAIPTWDQDLNLPSPGLFKSKSKVIYKASVLDFSNFDSKVKPSLEKID